MSLKVESVTAFRCSDMSLHPSLATAKQHEEYLAAEKLYVEFRGVLLQLLNDESIRVDEGDVAVVTTKLMKYYEFTAKKA